MAESLNGGLRQSGPVFLMQPAMHVEMKEAANRGRSYGQNSTAKTSARLKALAVTIIARKVRSFTAPT
jgi:hypothetical protein